MTKLTFDCILHNKIKSRSHCQQVKSQKLLISSILIPGEDMKINVSLIGRSKIKKNHPKIASELLHFYHFAGNYLWILGRDIGKIKEDFFAFTN